MAKVDVYEMVTNAVIELIETQGVLPWSKPWQGVNAHPANATTGKPYRGINPFLLAVRQHQEGYGDHRWLTFKQAKDAGGSVRKGEKSTLVVFWSWYEKKIVEDGETQKARFPVLKYFRVFNVEQCDGLDPAKLKGEADKFEPNSWEAIESAEAIAEGYLDRSGLRDRLECKGARACYKPLTDELQMPERERFENAAKYYAVLFHEMGHSTGHETRLNREIKNQFADTKYGKEELIAEMTSAFLCGEAGIFDETVEHSAAYLQGWLKILKSDKRLLPTAAAAAQKAADFILDRTFEPAEADAKQPTRVG
ncbi:DUF1738 domain-containing protein [bacterium]|nr:DUF1738 domain-containing protein [bacterium]